MIRTLLRRWLGIESKSPIDDTLSYQNRKLVDLNGRVCMLEAKAKAADKAAVSRILTPAVQSMAQAASESSPAALRALRRVPAEER